MALIYELAHPLLIDDTQITFRIKDHLDADLTTTEDGLKLVNAFTYMNSADFTNDTNNVGTILTIRNFAWTLGHGYEAGGFDYSGYFQALDGLSGNSHTYNQGTLGVSEPYISTTLPAYRFLHGADIASNGASDSTFWGDVAGYSYSSPESIVWEAGNENYSVLITFNLPTSGSHWESDYVRCKHMDTLWDSNALVAGFDVTMGDAPFVEQIPTEAWINWVNINKVDFYGYEGCIGAIFSILEIDASSNPTELIKIYPTSEVPEITDSFTSQVTSLQPYVWGANPPNYIPIEEATTYNFGLSITDINIPTSVVENETVECSFKINSVDFNGQVNTTIFGISFQNNLGEEVIVNYGTIQWEGGDDTTQSYDITAGGQIQANFTYTANDVATQQTDSFYIFSQMITLDASAYGDDSDDAQSQFNQLVEEEGDIFEGGQLGTFADTPYIQVLDEGQDPDDVEIPSEFAIVKPSDIIYHLAKTELGYDKDIDPNSIDESRANHDDGWDLGFCINKEIDSKKLIQEISQSSKSFPTFSNDRLKFITIKSTYDGTEDINTIKSAEVIKYNFSRTKIEDVKTQIEVKHKYDYGLKNHIETTGEIKINEHYVVNNAYWLTGTYGDLLGGNLILNNYYGIKRTDTAIDHIDTFLTVENDYIRESGLAERFARYLLYWHMNQHNIVELTLPLKYFALEIGDLIEFDDMILGKKVYGENYSRTGVDFDMPFRCGQYILPLFMVTETSKSIKDIKIKAIQLHNMTTGELNYKGEVYPSIDESDVNPQDFPTDIPEDEEIIVYPEGDLNQDGIVNVLDAILLIQIILYGDQEGGNSNDLIDSLDDMLDE